MREIFGIPKDVKIALTNQGRIIKCSDEQNLEDAVKIFSGSRSSVAKDAGEVVLLLELGYCQTMLGGSDEFGYFDESQVELKVDDDYLSIKKSKSSIRNN